MRVGTWCPARKLSSSLCGLQLARGPFAHWDKTMTKTILICTAMYSGYIHEMIHDLHANTDHFNHTDTHRLLLHLPSDAKGHRAGIGYSRPAHSCVRADCSQRQHDTLLLAGYSINLFVCTMHVLHREDIFSVRYKILTLSRCAASGYTA